MKTFSSIIRHQGQDVKVNVQEIGLQLEDGAELYLVQLDGTVLAVVSVDGHCNFKVIEGNYRLEELQPVCQRIKEFKEAKNEG